MGTTKKAGGVAYHLGHRVGRVWRGLASREQRAVAWLVDHGWAPGLARTMPWAIKLLVVGTLIYAAFWLALLLLFAAAAGRAVSASHPVEEDEWPFTDLNELRKIPGYDPNLYNDTSHEMYTDD